MAKKLQNKNVNDFWKEVKVINNSKMPPPSSVNGVTGLEQIAQLWRQHYEDIFNCVKSEEFNVGNVVLNDNVIIRPDEVQYSIEKLYMNKACGLDQITAEHLKHACHRLPILLSMCLTSVLMHGILPERIMSVLLKLAIFPALTIIGH